MRDRILGALAVVAISLLPHAALAEGSEPGAAKFSEGVAAFEKGSYGAAADAFGLAYAESHSSTHLWNLALAEIKADRPFDALSHLRLYVKASDASPQNVKRASILIERTSHEVGRLSISAPDGCEVLVDGATIGRAPLQGAIEVDPGKPHLVEAHAGHRVAHSSVAPPGNSQVDVKLVLPEEPPPPPPAAVAATVPAPVVPAGKSSAPPPPEERSGDMPHQGLLITLVVTEVLASAASAGAGVGLYSEGSAHHDSGKETSGAILMGVAGLFMAADVLTLRLWPRYDAPASAKLSVAPAFGGFSLRGAF